MTSYILVFAAQEIYAACVTIWNVLPPSRPPTVFRFSADQINVFVRCTFFGSRSPSAVHRRPLVLDYAPSLSGVSQLLSVCFPADWLQRGATPAASPASVPRPPSCCSSPGRSSETVLVFPSCPNIIVLVGGVVLPPPHAALGTDRLARRPSCKACQKSATLPLAKKVPYVTRPTSCSHPGMFAVPVARRHRIPFSILACMLLLRHPHAGFGAYRRAAQKTRRKNRKDNQCLRSAKGVLLLCPHADFGAGQRQGFPRRLKRDFR